MGYFRIEMRALFLPAEYSSLWDYWLLSQMTMVTWCYDSEVSEWAKDCDDGQVSKSLCCASPCVLKTALWWAQNSFETMPQPPVTPFPKSLLGLWYKIIVPLLSNASFYPNMPSSLIQKRNAGQNAGCKAAKRKRSANVSTVKAPDNWHNLAGIPVPVCNTGQHQHSESTLESTSRIPSVPVRNTRQHQHSEST